MYCLKFSNGCIIFLWKSNKKWYATLNIDVICFYPKVRAQAVLRQNQTVDHSQEEQLKEEAAALKAQVEAMTAKLFTAQ